MNGDTSSTTQRPLRVLVVDDHGLFGRGLELLLGAASGERIHVVASTADPLEVEDLVTTHDVDVVLVDLNMPTRSGEDVIAGVKMISPDVRVLIVSGSDDLDRITAALRSGADGFVPKTSDPAELLGPILSVAAGWSVLPRPVLDDLISQPRRQVELSDRDLWMLRRLATGAEMKQLATGLHVSERTVKRSVAILLEQLGVKSRIEAVALAGRLGMLEEPAELDSAPPG